MQSAEKRLTCKLLRVEPGPGEGALCPARVTCKQRGSGRLNLLCESIRGRLFH